MSIDLFASYAVKQAVLSGDLEPSTAQILSLLPRTIQESSLRRLASIPDAVTAIQLFKSIEHSSIDLADAKFDLSPCVNCLHYTQNASSFTGDVGTFTKNRCLFSLCAQHDAQDQALLDQRTVFEFSPTGQHDMLAAQTTADSEFNFADVQMDIGEPVFSEDMGSSTPSEPLASEPAMTDAPHQEMPEQSDESNPQAQPALAHENEALSAQPPETSQPESYIETVRNAWWRNALAHRVADQGSHRELQDFLIACLSAGHQPVQSSESESPVNLFLDIASKKPEELLAKMAADLINTLPLNVVGDFLKMFAVDLTMTGETTISLLSALSLDELVAVADELNIQTTNELMDAYEEGSKSFAHALAWEIGKEKLAIYIPHSLRP